jgi:hypothetical protein
MGRARAHRCITLEAVALLLVLVLFPDLLAFVGRRLHFAVWGRGVVVGVVIWSWR